MCKAVFWLSGRTGSLACILNFICSSSAITNLRTFSNIIVQYCGTSCAPPNLFLYYYPHPHQATIEHASPPHPREIKTLDTLYDTRVKKKKTHSCTHALEYHPLPPYKTHLHRIPSLANIAGRINAARYTYFATTYRPVSLNAH